MSGVHSAPSDWTIWKGQWIQTRYGHSIRYRISPISHLDRVGEPGQRGSYLVGTSFSAFAGKTGFPDTNGVAVRRDPTDSNEQERFDRPAASRYRIKLPRMSFWNSQQHIQIRCYD